MLIRAEQDNNNNNFAAIPLAVKLALKKYMS